MKNYILLKLSTLFVIALSFCLISANAQSKDQKAKEKNIFVFVGEKIEVKSFSPELEENEILMDSAYKAKYKIIKPIFGKYNEEIIEFEAYDHYGYPSFANYKNVLLFLTKEDGIYYQIKYQFFDIYETKNGNWATCGDPYRFDTAHRGKIKAVKLNFNSPPIFDIEKELPNFNDEFVKSVFVKPYFEVKNNKAKCLMGNYVEQLFEVKKQGWLKEIGFFPVMNNRAFNE